MPTFLVHVDAAGDSFKRVGLEILTRAAQLAGELGGDVHAVVTGGSADAASLGRYGATTVHVAEGEQFTSGLPGPAVDAVLAAVEASGADHVLLASSGIGKDVAAGVAARLGAGLNYDLTDLRVENGALVGQVSNFGGAVIATIGWTGTPAVGTIRPNSFQAEETGGGTATVQPLSVEVRPHHAAARVVSTEPAQEARVSLEEASTIVSGGRGLQDPSNFSLVEGLAKELGAAVGASRAAVDAGWYPHPQQVGQTGKTVAPQLYIAVGISGAIQHKVGMQTSDTIVAINKDGDAPIFGFADLGVVGDLFTIVPKLTELVREHKAR